MIIIISLISLLPHEIELFEEDFSYTKIFFAPEVLFDFLNNPLDINLASYDDFSQLPFITAVLAKAIVEYRKKNGDFKNTDELLSVDGMDRKLLNENRQFLKDVRV
ncbi:MAG: helix-hairpin-helix domain-containing protein, partial [candidate division WOR-3 bacterium]|nr:helix-hairpin-helix domain-containing protein [candidate division WOR-3 bacterium]